MEHSNFDMRFETIKKYVKLIEDLGRETLSVYQNLNQLANELKLKIKYIFFPDLTVTVSNPTEKLEFVFLVRSGFLDILYTPLDLEVMKSGSNLAFIELYKNMQDSKKDKLSIIERNIRETKEKNKNMLRVIDKTIDKLIEEDKIDQNVYEAINFLQSCNYPTDDIWIRVNDRLCSTCRGNKKSLVCLECNHRYCLNCFTELIKKATQGYYVLNDLEKENSGGIHCILENCGNAISEEILKAYLPDYNMYAKSSEARIKLNCNCCGFEGKLNDFMIECHHICNECLFDTLRNGNSSCPDCKMKMKENDIRLYRDQTTLCEGCNKYLNSIKYFTKKMCEHNLCIECLSESTDMCCIDLKPFPEHPGIDFKDLNRKTCKGCKERYPKIS